MGHLLRARLNDILIFSFYANSSANKNTDKMLFFILFCVVYLGGMGRRVQN
jgi:hypothetical protein